MSSKVVGQMIPSKTEFKWEIENIRSVLNQEDQCLSPEFSIDGLIWQLEMCPKGINKTASNYISIYLRLKSQVHHETNYSLSIIDNNRSQCNQRISGIRKFSPLAYPSWGFLKFIEHQQLFDKADRYLFEDKFVILLELYSSSYHVYNILPVNFENILNNNQYCDVQFYIKNDIKDQHLYAHKSILSKKSEVFAAMFEHSMKENIENAVLIEDIDHQVIVEMLRFIYTGEVKNMENIAEKLIFAAEKYAILDLKDVCCDYFYHNLSDKNAIQYLNIASLYNVGGMKLNVKKYILSNIKSMVSTSEFRAITDLQSDELYEIICSLVSKLS